MQKIPIIETKSLQELQEKSIVLIETWIREACEVRGSCMIGLSGGSAARTLYAALGTKDDLPWDALKFFLIDERFVAADHDESNQRLVWETLFRSHVPPSDHLCFPQTSMPLDACIEEYEKSLLALLDGRAPDIVILGMGDDGHIASLFPNDKTAIFEESRSVLHTTTDTFAIHDRITVTLPILKNAEHRIFLLIGEKKRATLNAMKKEKLNIERWPAHALCDGKTTWILG